MPANNAEQTALAYSNMKHVLSQFGEDMGNIGGKPNVSQTGRQVVTLVQPELQVEIKCIAHL